MLSCNDGSFYVGITNDLERRVGEHARGQGPSYTAKRLPVQLVWSERFSGQSATRKREVEIKGWSRRKKLALARKNPSASPQGKGA
jgi:predicted GIY-YIG superfamily endonuclease